MPVFNQDPMNPTMTGPLDQALGRPPNWAVLQSVLSTSEHFSHRPHRLGLSNGCQVPTSRSQGDPRGALCKPQRKYLLKPMAVIYIYIYNFYTWYMYITVITYIILNVYNLYTTYMTHIWKICRVHLPHLRQHRSCPLLCNGSHRPESSCPGLQQMVVYASRMEGITVQHNITIMKWGCISQYNIKYLRFPPPPQWIDHYQ